MPWFHSFSVSIYCIILPCRCSQHNFHPSFSHIVTSMSSTKSLFPSIFLVASLILLSYFTYRSSTSLEYHRAILQIMPKPIPSYLIGVYPEPGSFLGWNKNARNSILELPCIYFHGTNFLGKTIGGENGIFWDMFQLKLNGIPSTVLSQKFNVVHTIGWYESLETDEQEVCWSLPIYPDEYLAEVTLYGSSTEQYQWAFNITEN